MKERLKSRDLTQRERSKLKRRLREISRRASKKAQHHFSALENGSYCGDFLKDVFGFCKENPILCALGAVPFLFTPGPDETPIIGGAAAGFGGGHVLG